jgi:hypothetical protein
LYFATRGKSSRINGRGIGILPMGYPGAGITDAGYSAL